MAEPKPGDTAERRVSKERDDAGGDWGRHDVEAFDLDPGDLMPSTYKVGYRASRFFETGNHIGRRELRTEGNRSLKALY